MVSDYGCRPASLYVLRLDRHTVGEEFGKRNRSAGCSTTARRAADAQSARWRSEGPIVAMTCTRDRATGAIHDGCHFNLWQIGGYKELHHLGTCLALRVLFTVFAGCECDLSRAFRQGPGFEARQHLKKLSLMGDLDAINLRLFWSVLGGTHQEAVNPRYRHRNPMPFRSAVIDLIV